MRKKLNLHLSFIVFFKKTNQYYNPTVQGCVVQGGSGSTCQADNQCLSGLGCDTQRTGEMTYTCRHFYGFMCTSYANCVNNLDCISGSCGCDVRSSFIFLF